jgi:hypothetical protein
VKTKGFEAHPPHPFTFFNRKKTYMRTGNREELKGHL